MSIWLLQRYLFQIQTCVFLQWDSLSHDSVLVCSFTLDELVFGGWLLLSCCSCGRNIIYSSFLLLGYGLFAICQVTAILILRLLVKEVYLTCPCRFFSLIIALTLILLLFIATYLLLLLLLLLTLEADQVVAVGAGRAHLVSCMPRSHCASLCCLLPVDADTIVCLQLGSCHSTFVIAGLRARIILVLLGWDATRCRCRACPAILVEGAGRG